MCSTTVLQQLPQKETVFRWLIRILECIRWRLKVWSHILFKACFVCFEQAFVCSWIIKKEAIKREAFDLCLERSLERKRLNIHLSSTSHFRIFATAGFFSALREKIIWTFFVIVSVINFENSGWLSFKEKRRKRRKFFFFQIKWKKDFLLKWNRWAAFNWAHTCSCKGEQWSRPLKHTHALSRFDTAA